MSILKALSKQLFGAKYERVTKSLAACLILFLAVHAAEISMEIAPSVLFLTAAALSAGIMWQALHSSGNADSMAGLLMLPFTNREMTFSFVLAFTGYTLLTKTLPVLALFFAVHDWSVPQMAVSLLCACNGCFAAAAWYSMMCKAPHLDGEQPHRQMKQLFCAALWCMGILPAVFFVHKIMVFTLIVLASLFLSILKLLAADAYVFYRPASAKPLVRRSKGTGSILLYLLRYLITNKNYLMNTAGLCAVGVILPMLLGQFEGVNVMPLGFAILCLNTPICILLSCDSGLEQAVRILPGQAGRFCTGYGCFIFTVNMAVSSLYLMSWQIRHGGVGGMEIMAAVLIALQSAVLSVLLEWFHPIRNWKIENDLWHHPRKYVVPFIMLLIAGSIGMWPVSIWVFLCIVAVEIPVLLFILLNS